MLCLVIRGGESFAAPPRVSLDQEGATFSARPGERFAWIVVSHERHGQLNRLATLRGHAAAAPNGVVRIPRAQSQEGRAIWFIANVDDGSFVLTTPEGYEPPADPVRITASPGETAFTIKAPEARALYIRPGEGAWTFSGGDGASGDADGVQNTLLVVALTSLESTDGRQPPSAVQSGDVILTIDSRWLRVGKAVVGQ